MNLAAGCIIEFSAKGSQPETGVVLNSAGGTVRVLLLNGKETTTQEKKVLHATGRAVTTVSDRETCRQNLVNANNSRRQIYETINLQELHELVAEEAKSFSLKELAGFLFAPEDDDSAAALLRRLCEDRLYFRNKNDAYFPATPEEVAAAKEQLQKKQAIESEEAALVDALKLLENSGTLSEQLKPHINDLKNLAACEEEAAVNKRLGAALEKSGMTSARKMFQALVKAKIFSPDENLLITRYRLPVEFSRELAEEAERLCRTPQPAGRKNLVHLQTWAIDTPGSKDRDDAFSLENTAESGYRLWVHIADPAELIKPESPLDKEASRRGSSVYMPDLRIHMLPPEISENNMSLNEGADRLALSFALDFSAGLELVNLEICESVIRISRAIDYDYADSIFQTEPWLQQAYSLATALKKKRAANGAVMFPRQPELSIRLENGEIIIEHRNRDDMTAGMIAEFMIWANHAAADWCRKNSIPCLYRVQEGDGNTVEFTDTFDPVTFFAALRTFRKTTVSANAGRHYSLGLDAYTQVTSPLRRYSDLLLHRQIKAVIRGEQPPYSQNELAQAMLFADSAISRADEIMRDRERYFLYKYLKQQQKNGELVFSGTVVDTGMTEVTFYVDFLCSFRHCRKPSFDVSIGQKIGVKVNQIDLFDGLIRFDLRPA
jgi:exoribonuclease-2